MVSEGTAARHVGRESSGAFQWLSCRPIGERVLLIGRAAREHRRRVGINRNRVSRLLLG